MGMVSESFGFWSSGISLWPSSVVVVVIVGGKDCGGVSVLEFAVSCSPFDVAGCGDGTGSDMDMGSWFSELIFVVVT